MVFVRNSISYCCVSKGDKVLYNYNSGDLEIENLATLCLESTPPYHQWYFQTMAKNTFGFFMDDGFVYFAIVNESLGNLRVLQFLQKLRDEFRKLGKTGSSRSFSSLNSLCLQEQLLPVVGHLVASLEHVSKTKDKWANQGELTPSIGESANGHFQRGTSTKAPLLGKNSKQEKRKKDHAIGTRVIEMEEQRRSTDRGMMIDMGGIESNSQGTIASPLRKDLNSRGIKSSSHNSQKKWCRLVRIVLAIDGVICVILFAVWLIICHGIDCTR